MRLLFSLGFFWFQLVHSTCFAFPHALDLSYRKSLEDISRWIDEHPGGPSIIPTQALNIDCTIFFEMYHVSRQSFLYLKSFYIGELAPEDAPALRSMCSAKGAPVEASQGFLDALRSHTREWRVQIKEHQGERVHKSL